MVGNVNLDWTEPSELELPLKQRLLEGRLEEPKSLCVKQTLELMLLIVFGVQGQALRPPPGTWKVEQGPLLQREAPKPGSFPQWSC